MSFKFCMGQKTIAIAAMARLERSSSLAIQDRNQIFYWIATRFARAMMNKQFT
jgi:hypothetical protein